MSPVPARPPLFAKLLRFRLFHVFALIVLVLGAAVCGDDEGLVAPTVKIAGAHGLAVGETLSLSATTAVVADSAYQWSSSEQSIASVDAAGVVTGVAAGEAVISAQGLQSGAAGSHLVVVTAQPQASDPTVSISGSPFVKVGDTVVLTATTVNAEDSGYTWTSSDDVIATVDLQGVVTGRAVGEVTITALGDVSAVSDTLLLQVSETVPNYDAWAASAHADIVSEPFSHWNQDDPAEIPTACARCHSGPGFLDYIGADGSAVNSVEQAVPVGSVINCGACHNDTADQLSAVTFPSGVEITGLGPEARCMTCHQGRASAQDVDDAIATAAVTSDDEPSAQLSFLNIHYYAAAATLEAGRVRGGYQYADQVYDWRFRHVPGYDSCVGCHDPHSLEVKVDECKACHTNVNTKDDLVNIRMIASLGQDYDGDGDKTEGLSFEIDGLRTMLLNALTVYTTEQGLGGICYADAVYPYWFKDSDQSGDCNGSEAEFANRFDGWTARLLRAAYNFQVSSKDPGAYAHNGKYIIQLLYDAIDNLNDVLIVPVDLSNADRNDPGHFNGASEAARHWDADETVSASCSRCHGGSEGFRFYLQYGVGIEVPEQDNGLDCATCHDNFGTTFDLVTVDSVTFPSGITIAAPGNKSNICMTCHQGRESKKTIDDAISANKLGFRNVHYLPAGSVKKGTLAKVGYEYDGKTYAGEWVFHGQCVNCHDAKNTLHSFLPADNMLCTNGCHAPTPVDNIRAQHNLDYDGDSNASESLHDEHAGMAAAMFTQFRINADVTGDPICYNTSAYPYFFRDTNNNGTCEPGEATNANRYTQWTPALMKAAHNYQIFQKDPGAWAHNFEYIGQLLYDSIEDLGGTPAAQGLIRP